MKEKEILIKIKDGLEPSPVAHLVQLAGKFNSSIYLVYGTKHINAKSIMGMMSLALTEGTTVNITADGDDEDEAITAIEKFLS